jgi:hypothetical protein
MCLYEDFTRFFADGQMAPEWAPTALSLLIMGAPHGGAYTWHLDPDVHRPGTRHTQHIERPHLT